MEEKEKKKKNLSDGMGMVDVGTESADVLCVVLRVDVFFVKFARTTNLAQRQTQCLVQNTCN